METTTKKQLLKTLLKNKILYIDKTVDNKNLVKYTKYVKKFIYVQELLPTDIEPIPYIIGNTKEIKYAQPKLIDDLFNESNKKMLYVLKYSYNDIEFKTTIDILFENLYQNRKYQNKQINDNVYFIVQR